MRECQLEHGVPRAQAYDITAYILCGLLVVGISILWGVWVTLERPGSCSSNCSAAPIAYPAMGGRKLIRVKPLGVRPDVEWAHE
jgi:hypothetical protein